MFSSRKNLLISVCHRIICAFPLVPSMGVLFSLLMLLPRLAMSDVINESAISVFVKPERGSRPIEVKAGTSYRGEQDGIAVMGRVIKSSDGVDLLVDATGEVTARTEGLLAYWIEWLVGGELSESPDSGWDPLFHRAQQQAEKLRVQTTGVVD